MVVVNLYTHSITNTFSALNLLGYLYLIKESGAGVIKGVYPEAGWYRIEVLTNSKEWLLERLEKGLKEAVARAIIKGEKERISFGSFTYNVNRYVKKLKSVLDSIGEIGIKNLEDVIFRPRHHGREGGRVSKPAITGSPSLFLAPELGKYATSGVLYVSKYPRFDYACISISYVGLRYMTFNLRFRRERVDHYLIVAPSVVAPLNYFEARSFYTICRSISILSRITSRAIGRAFKRKKQEEERALGLSSIGFFVLLSPYFKEIASLEESLGKLRLVEYIVEQSDRMAVRLFNSFPLSGVRRLPDSLAGEFLTNPERLASLALEAPEYFHLLGEYLLTGHHETYINAMRTLARVLSNGEISSFNRDLAKDLLVNSRRRV
ncbi:MAG: hypothetical protein J7L11_05100 [Thermoprotei archaeon]|nr:hypothetical protein [Thermoprotei archaeon]